MYEVLVDHGAAKSWATVDRLPDDRSGLYEAGTLHDRKLMDHG